MRFHATASFKFRVVDPLPLLLLILTYWSILFTRGIPNFSEKNHSIIGEFCMKSTGSQRKRRLRTNWASMVLNCFRVPFWRVQLIVFWLVNIDATRYRSFGDNTLPHLFLNSGNRRKLSYFTLSIWCSIHQLEKPKQTDLTYFCLTCTIQEEKNYQVLSALFSYAYSEIVGTHCYKWTLSINCPMLTKVCITALGRQRSKDSLGDDGLQTPARLTWEEIKQNGRILCDCSR